MVARRAERRNWRRNGEEGAGDAAPAGFGAAPLDLSILPAHIGYVVRRAQLVIFKDFIQTLDRVKVRPAQYAVLVVISRNPGLTQAELGRTLAIKRANLVGMLNELERRDLARRVPSPADRRSHALYLTANGRKMLTRFQRLAAEHEERATRMLSPSEKQSLLEMLQRVATSLS